MGRLFVFLKPIPRLPFQNFNLHIQTGNQEYSSRNAGITSAIVMAIIIPLILGIAYAGYKIFQRRQQDTANEQEYEVETLRR